MVWDSEIFAGEKKTRLTAMLREESIHPEQEAIAALKEHLKIAVSPDYISSHFAFQAIPQFEIGHEERILAFKREITEKFPSLRLTGNYFIEIYAMFPFFYACWCFLYYVWIL